MTLTDCDGYTWRRGGSREFPRWHVVEVNGRMLMISYAGRYAQGQRYSSLRCGRRTSTRAGAIALAEGGAAPIAPTDCDPGSSGTWARWRTPPDCDGVETTPDNDCKTTTPKED